MRSVVSLAPSLLGLVFLLACGSGSGGEGDAVPGPETAPGSGASVQEAAAEPSCWLRNATPEEAAERASPLGETTIVLNGQVGKLCYGRPSARGRTVEGGLIPFGEPWRLGANEATVLHLPFPARIGGIEVEPGSYSLFAIPDEFEWEFVLNAEAERWGIPINEEVRSADLGSFTGLPLTMTEPVEQFTVDWHTHGGANGHLVLEWGRTRVEIEVSLLDPDS